MDDDAPFAKAITDAIAAAVSTELDGLAINYLGIIDYVAPDGDSRFHIVAMPGQQLLTGIGLSEALSIAMRGQVDDIMRSAD